LKHIKPHPNTPKRLIRLFKKMNCNYYKTAKEIEINVGHVYSIIVHGHEPKREDLRRKLFFKARQSSEELKSKKEERKKKQQLVNDEITKHFLQVMEMFNGK